MSKKTQQRNYSVFVDIIFSLIKFRQINTRMHLSIVLLRIKLQVYMKKRNNFTYICDMLYINFVIYILTTSIITVDAIFMDKSKRRRGNSFGA